MVTNSFGEIKLQDFYSALVLIAAKIHVAEALTKADLNHPGCQGFVHTLRRKWN